MIFEAPAESIVELERRPADHRGAAAPPRHPGRAPDQGRPRRDDADDVELELEGDELPSVEDEDEELTGEQIDESESEAAPAAID